MRGPIGVVPPEATIHIYRIVQEALTNVSRHSGAKEARVPAARSDDGRIELEIEDRGSGLPPKARTEVDRGIGLVSMRERAELMGGSSRCVRRPAAGSSCRSGAVGMRRS